VSDSTDPTIVESHLPTPVQKLLLKTIIGPADQVIKNWQKWQSQLDLDDIDAGSYRVMPMLNHVLRQHGAEGPDIPRYHGVARKVWYENKLTFHRTAQIIKQWQSEGREIAVLKGIPLAHIYYPDPALRPMDDADLLVPLNQAAPAIDWFLAHGWHSLYDKSRNDLVTYSIKKEHSADLRRPSGLNVDLHWQILNFPLPPKLVQEIWDAMRPVTFGDVTTQTLCPTDHLLHICAHGNAWNEVPPLRWIIDAHFILKKDAANIDWERLVRLTTELHIAHFVSPALHYLHEEFNEPVPAAVLAQLRQIPRQDWHENEYLAWTSSDPFALRDYSLRYRFHRLRATNPEWSAKSPWRAQRDYLKLHWELDSDFKLLGRLAQRVGEKIRAKLTR
jgi:hypothetical protein